MNKYIDIIYVYVYDIYFQDEFNKFDSDSLFFFAVN